MKLIRCNKCGEVIALWHRAKFCECGDSGGHYNPDGRTAIVWGPCSVFGVNNAVFYGQRTDAWPYDESNGRITRFEKYQGTIDNPHKQG